MTHIHSREKKNVNRKEYMRLYMQQHRQTLAGKDENRQIIREKHKNPKYREKEVTLQMNRCSDPVYRNKEASLMQEKRSDPAYRQKEVLLKQEK